MDLATILAFAAAFFVFAASPGPDNMTIVARTISSGAASGIAYGAGTVVGILIFLVLAAFGLSIIAAKMAIVMTVLRYGGAAYLIWMGIRLWTAVPVVPELQPVSGGRGLLTILPPASRSISAIRKCRCSTLRCCRTSSAHRSTLVISVC